MTVEGDDVRLEGRTVIIKRGNGNHQKTVWVLLGTIIAIFGFLGTQLWSMNERLARVETTVQSILRGQE